MKIAAPSTALAGRTTNSSRRRFVQGVACGGALVAWGSGEAATTGAAIAQATLTGTEFDLIIDSASVNFTGRTRTATTVNGSVPGPLLRMREGTTVTIRVTNRLSVPSSIHWHGLLLPFEMDGVPGISFPGIEPGKTFVYTFKVLQSGTYWYHSHSRFQEQTGIYGPLIIDPAKTDPVMADRDYVLMLSDWTDQDPEWVYKRLKQSSDFFNYQMPTGAELFRDISAMGLKKAWEKRKMWNQMRMNPTDLGDVSGATYTYLANGKSPAANWTAIARPGEKVRLRVINGSASTIFDLRIPGVKMKVVSADGQPVNAVEVDEMRISVAETYDVVVEMPDDKAYTIFAQSIDRTGYARATLAPRDGMQAPVPELDPKTWLTMTDMGMGDMEMGEMAGHDMSTMPGMQGDGGKPTPPSSAMAGHDMSSMSGMQGMDSKTVKPSASSSDMAGHDMSSMPGMKSAPSDGSKAATAGHDMSSMPGMKGMQGGTSKPSAPPSGMAGHDMSSMSGMKGMQSGEMGDLPPIASEPGVDSRVMSPSKSLNDPGPRLRGNGRRVLTYADLRTIGGPLDLRAPSREITLRLTGNMQRFMWSFDGKKFSEAEPLYFKYGERLRIILINDSMMNHPIHLHGMFSELESEDQQFLVRKHTINVQPGKQLSFLVTADAPGQWAFHCHLLYHMEAGMFRMVVVA